MRRSLAGLLTVAIAVALVGLVACGGDSDDGDGDGSPTAAATGSAPAATETTTPGAAVPDTATPDPTASPAEEFTAVLERLDDAEYRISYAFTTEASGQSFTGALTWIRAADGRERFETSSEQGGERFLLVVITEADGEQVTCFDVGGFESCFRGEDGPFAELPNPTEIIFQNVIEPDRIDGVRETESRTILGMETTCYEVDAGGGTSEACIGEGNLLLSASWRAPNGDGGGFEASEFSTTVSDEDFEPIAPIEG